MNLGRPLQVVTPTLDGDILAVLAGAETALTGRAIERAIGHASHGGVRHALARLVGQGIVVRQGAGRAHLYRLNRQHVAAPWIEGLASLRLELIDRLRQAIDDWQLHPIVAVLFGSAARAEAGRESDLDILVVRPDDCDEDDRTWREQVVRLEEAATAWTGNDARILEYGESEARQLAPSEPVLRAAASGGIELFGSLRSLRPTRETRRR